MWLSWFKSNEKEILNSLDKLAEKAVNASEILLELLQDVENKQVIEKIHLVETEADRLAHDVFLSLNRSFITPLDPEDMRKIASEIDDVIDLTDGVASRLQGYKITTAPKYANEITRELILATKEIKYMVSKLDDKKNLKKLIERCKNVNKIEHNVDEYYKTAIGELFQTDNAVNILKLKDVYQTMEAASDSCKDVADVVEDIVLKYG